MAPTSQEPARKRSSTATSRATAESFTGSQSLDIQRPLIARPKDRGVAVAAALFAGWAAVFYYAHTQICLWGPDASSIWETAATFLALEFLYTGLFITTHDAFHGGVAPKNKPLNDLIGAVAIYIFACFDYKSMHKKHMAHHEHTGRVGSDPDFHHGNIQLLPWFGSFMWDYLTWQQVVKINLEATTLVFLFHVPFANIMLFKWTAPIISAFRLFYFGTYLPHCPEDATEVMSWEKTRTTKDSKLASFLKCYHFDCHWEHHKWPQVPWWQLFEYHKMTTELPGAFTPSTAMPQTDAKVAETPAPASRNANPHQLRACPVQKQTRVVGLPASRGVNRAKPSTRFAGRQLPVRRQMLARVV